MRNRTLVLALATAALGCTEAQPCPEPLEVCGGVCVDTLSDVEHCGACAAACAPAQVCLGGACLADEQVPCAARTGGAWVTFETCAQSVTAWIDAAADQGSFLVTAEGAAAAGTANAAFPLFRVLGGADCDGQWTWHVEASTARIAATKWSLPGCAACPTAVEAAAPSWIGADWCPGSDVETVTFRVVRRSP